LEEVAANYEKFILLALEYVESAFVAHRSSTDTFVQLSQVEASAEKALRLADALYKRGSASYLAVLDAQSSKLAVSEERVKVETAVSVALDNCFIIKEWFG
jgi:outer membrane protein TolC